jgi:hypothetical protein
VNFWARLHDGNHAHLMLNNLIKKGGVNLLWRQLVRPERASIRRAEFRWD